MTIRRDSLVTGPTLRGWERIVALASAGVLALLLAGCGGAEGLDYRQQLEFRFEFTLTSSGGKLAPGNRVTFLVGDCSNTSCSTVSNIHQVFSGTANASSAVPVAASVFYDDQATAFFSIYKDANGNGVMDSGDLVWGSNANSFTGIYGQPWFLYTGVGNRGTFEQGLSVINYTGVARPW